MMKNQKSSNFTLSILLLLLTILSNVEARCKPSGYVRGKKPPPGECAELNCCTPNKLYPIYQCSPPVSTHTKALLRITSFENGYISMCDDKYHNDNMMVASVSTGWFNKGERCDRNIIIHGNGKNVSALVIDETDSAMGCDVDHDYQPPSPNNVVDASKAVWKALGVPLHEWGELSITWSDA